MTRKPCQAREAYRPLGAHQGAQLRMDLRFAYAAAGPPLDGRHTELRRPARGAAGPHELAVQTLAAVGSKLPVGGPGLESAPSEPRLQLARDALLGPRLAVSAIRGHGRLVGSSTRESRDIAIARFRRAPADERLAGKLGQRGNELGLRQQPALVSLDDVGAIAIAAHAEGLPRLLGRPT